MNRYIAYFDILGFKEFIDNNTQEYVNEQISFVYRESQFAVSKGASVQGHGGVAVADLSAARVNCMHFSDSIIFWSQDDTADSFLEMVNVCLRFYQMSMQASFPVRGCMIFGNVEFNPLQFPGQGGAAFFNSSLYGRGFVDAYLKGEAQDWAGCYVDRSAIDNVEQGVLLPLIYDRKLVYYAVPLKDGSFTYEHAFRITSIRLNHVHFRNSAINIERRFTQHMNGKPLPPSVQQKVYNTVKFLEHLRIEPEREPEAEHNEQEETD